MKQYIHKDKDHIDMVRELAVYQGGYISDATHRVVNGRLTQEKNKKAGIQLRVKKKGKGKEVDWVEEMVLSCRSDEVSRRAMGFRLLQEMIRFGDHQKVRDFVMLSATTHKSSIEEGLKRYCMMNPKKIPWLALICERLGKSGESDIVLREVCLALDLLGTLRMSYEESDGNAKLYWAHVLKLLIRLLHKEGSSSASLVAVWHSIVIQLETQRNGAKNKVDNIKEMGYLHMMHPDVAVRKAAIAGLVACNGVIEGSGLDKGKNKELEKEYDRVVATISHILDLSIQSIESSPFQLGPDYEKVSKIDALIPGVSHFASFSSERTQTYIVVVEGLLGYVVQLLSQPLPPSCGYVSIPFVALMNVLDRVMNIDVSKEHIEAIQLNVKEILISPLELRYVLPVWFKWVLQIYQKMLARLGGAMFRYQGMILRGILTVLERSALGDYQNRSAAYETLKELVRRMRGGIEKRYFNRVLGSLLEEVQLPISAEILLHEAGKGGDEVSEIELEEHLTESAFDAWVQPRIMSLQVLQQLLHYDAKAIPTTQRTHLDMVLCRLLMDALDRREASIGQPMLKKGMKGVDRLKQDLAECHSYRVELVKCLKASLLNPVMGQPTILPSAQVLLERGSVDIDEEVALHSMEGLKMVYLLLQPTRVQYGRVENPASIYLSETTLEVVEDKTKKRVIEDREDRSVKKLRREVAMIEVPTEVYIPPEEENQPEVTGMNMPAVDVDTEEELRGNMELNDSEEPSGTSSDEESE